MPIDHDSTREALQRPELKVDAWRPDPVPIRDAAGHAPVDDGRVMLS